MKTRHFVARLFLTGRRTKIAVAILFGGALWACVTTSSAPQSPPLDAAELPAEIDDTDTIPCEPRLVLQNVCQRCHRKPPIRGAPFPLVTRSNITRMTDDGQVRELMIQQLTVRRMPLYPETIDEADRTTLLDWLKAGAPAEPPHACEVVDAGDADAPGSSDAQADADATLDATPDADELRDAGDASDEEHSEIKPNREEENG